MCLVTKHPEQITTEDITVYKMVSLDDTPFYQDGLEPYKIGEEYKTDLGVSKFFNKYKAFVCYTTCWQEDEILREHGYYNSNLLTKINTGFHCFKPDSFFHNYFHNYVIENRGNLLVCTIPKGAKYYWNEAGNMVTNHLIINSYLIKG